MARTLLQHLEDVCGLLAGICSVVVLSATKTQHAGFGELGGLRQEIAGLLFRHLDYICKHMLLAHCPQRLPLGCAGEDSKEDGIYRQRQVRTFPRQKRGVMSRVAAFKDLVASAKLPGRVACIAFARTRFLALPLPLAIRKTLANIEWLMPVS